MTEHLPECPWPEKPCGPDHQPMHDRQPLFCTACLTECICDRLRACEQRVTERWESLRGWGESYAYKTGSDNGFYVGYAAGLDAAREAVERVPHWDGFDGITGTYRATDKDMALAAIDALREKP